VVPLAYLLALEVSAPNPGQFCTPGNFWHGPFIWIDWLQPVLGESRHGENSDTGLALQELKAHVGDTHVKA
jgi:hypothetical protein